MLFHGVITALVTPFKNGKVDESAFRAHIENQIASGVHGVVPCGSTGESATMTMDEHARVIEICIEQVNGRVPVLAGAGSNNTQEAIDLTLSAKKAGADGALLLTPYYNKPTQEGLYQHYRAIAEAVDLPLIPYNVPGRTGCNMLPPVVGRLAKDFPQIVGIKEATGNLVQGCEVLEACPKGFMLLSGDDPTAMPLIAMGATGVISVSSNIIPEKMVAMYTAFRKGDFNKAVSIHHEVLPLHKAMFLETNPQPVKTALSLMGRMTAEMRLPLCSMSGENTKILQKILQTYNLL